MWCVWYVNVYASPKRNSEEECVCVCVFRITRGQKVGYTATLLGGDAKIILVFVAP